MHLELLDILRCPFCGGRLELATSGFVHRRDDEILDGMLGCHCCAYPIVDGIPVIHLSESAASARAHIEAGRAGLARRALFGLGGPETERFETLAASSSATYRDFVDALGPNFEGGYFLYRFTDPTYIVAHAAVRAIAATVLGDSGRAIDLCGGSGHLTRALLDLSGPPPVLADLYFSKVWLGRRFTAPRCEGICCDGNAPLPFERGAFRLAVCSDAFHYIWTKRLFAAEMLRLVDAPDGRSAAVVAHAHNAKQWNPSAGMPLPPDAYRALFSGAPARLFGENALLSDIVTANVIDLSGDATDAGLGREHALMIVASRDARVFSRQPLEPAAAEAAGEFRVNPLYAAAANGDTVRLTLRFPSPDYEEEYAASRRYLPDQVVADRAALEALPAGTLPEALMPLARQRVVVDLPRRYC